MTRVQKKGEGMVILTVLGVLSIFFGFMLLFMPKQFKQLSDACNKILANFDEGVLKSRISFGLILFATGLVCFFLVYYFIKTSAL